MVQLLTSSQFSHAGCGGVPGAPKYALRLAYVDVDASDMDFKGNRKAIQAKVEMMGVEAVAVSFILPVAEVFALPCRAEFHLLSSLKCRKHIIIALENMKLPPRQNFQPVARYLSSPGRLICQHHPPVVGKAL